LAAASILAWSQVLLEVVTFAYQCPLAALKTKKSGPIATFPVIVLVEVQFCESVAVAIALLIWACVPITPTVAPFNDAPGATRAPELPSWIVISPELVVSSSRRVASASKSLIVVPTKEVPELAITREGAWAAWAINPEEKANMAKVVMEVRVLRNLAMVIPSSEYFEARGISLIHTLLALMGTIHH
jgi:hypothetical protein